MAGGKETPRQKMIGMMYLVLTALLALNVSKEILNAFVVIEEGLNETNHNFDGKNGLLYAKFAKAMAENPQRAGQWNSKAEQVKKLSTDLCKYIDELRGEVIASVHKDVARPQADTFQLKLIDSKDSYDDPTRILIGENPENATGKAVDLKKKINDYVKTITGLVPPKDQKSLKVGLNTEDVFSFAEEKKISWENNMFYHMPIASVLSNIAMIKNDIKNAESEIVSTLLRNVDEATIKFDKVKAAVVAPSNYIIAGEEFKADIFIAAYNSSSNPEIEIGDVDTTTNTIRGASTKVDSFSDGLGKYRIKTSAVGDQVLKGIIKVKEQGGSVKAYPFETSYTVAQPSFAVSPTKMNVFYIGVDNPVAISVAGAAPKDVIASCSGGSCVPSGKPGEYTVRVNSGTECSINVAVKTKTGTKSMGSMKFRVKRVPSPNASFAGIVGDGKASKGEIMNASGVIPKLDDFVFDLKFPVVSWKMSLFVNGAYADYSASGPSATGEMKNILGKMKSGQKVLIEEVKVKAPEGVRKIPGCVIKIM